MSLGERLHECRDRTALTQTQVARVLGVARELVSMWETGARQPSQYQLERLADLYQVPLASLLSSRSAGARHERALLERQSPLEPRARREMERWLDFLDAWAACLDEWGEELAGPRRPPRGLATEHLVTDARRAPTLAVKVRDHYRLGLDALPKLRTFLDEHDVLSTSP